ncbi:MAG TPA: hypothetical protein VK421_03130 [Pyrinomonadaceae bacterium]|nr:hypothetical protein [Pyrinomonadaceae bacterium]
MPLKFFPRPALLALLALSAAHAVAAQSPAGNAPPKVEVNIAAAAETDERAESIIKRAVEAVGGAAYLNVRTVVGRGNYTPYAKGVPGDLVAFLDYLAFPDRERTEFRSRGVRSIQTNVGVGADATGWIYDGMAKSLHDMRPEQIEDFRITMRTSLDSLLRGWWRKEGARLTYAGRREAGLARRNEAVRLTYPDGFAVDYEFGARDFLPAKVSYKRKNKEGEEQLEEDRFLRHMTFSGVTVPFVIDHYRAGVQTSRINYDSVEFNQRAPDALFEKPASAKAVK